MLISLCCGCCVKSRCWVLSNAEHPHGAARGAAVGVLSCYLDNIEITQAKRETLLLARLLCLLKYFCKSIDKYVYVWYTILVRKRYLHTLFGGY